MIYLYAYIAIAIIVSSVHSYQRSNDYFYDPCDSAALGIFWLLGLLVIILTIPGVFIRYLTNQLK